MNYIRKFDNIVEKFANEYMRDNKIVYGIVFLFLMLYSAHIAPKLPLAAVQVFDNTFFKIFIFTLILWIARLSPSMSILIAVAFLMTTNVMNQKKLLEFMDEDVEYEEGMGEDVEYEYEEGMGEDVEYEYEEGMDEDIEYEEGMDEDVEYEEMDEDVEYEEMDEDIEYEEGMDEDVEYEEEMDDVEYDYEEGMDEDVEYEYE